MQKDSNINSNYDNNYINNENDDNKNSNKNNINYDKEYSKDELVKEDITKNTLSELTLKLKSISKILRQPDGCPWDNAQSIHSLAEFILEETHEAYEAILNKDFNHLKEELGDILSQIFMISQIAEEQSKFTIKEVFEGIVEKLIRRHPHVFGEKSANDENEALRLWNKEKKKEKKERESRLDGVPSSLPALLYTIKIQRKASSYGFDWKDKDFSKQLENIFNKIYEETDEVKKELDKINLTDIINGRKNFNNFKKEENKSDVLINEDLEEEIGDLIFAVINLARKVKINPDFALRRSVNKFIKRFKYIEKEIDLKGLDINSLSAQELDKLWNQSKLSK